MYHIAFSILKDSFLAEDAVMDAFVKLLKFDYSIDNPESSDTKNLIIKTIQSTSIDIYRKNKRKFENEIFVDTNEELLNIEATNEEKDIVDSDLLKGLPENYKSVLYEKYINGKSNSEIAYMLDIKEATVRKRIERGIALIRKRRRTNHDVN